MNSLVNVGDSSQSPRGPPTPWSPVRASRRRGDLSSITPLHSDPHGQHAELANTKYEWTLYLEPNFGARKNSCWCRHRRAVQPTCNRKAQTPPMTRFVFRRGGGVQVLTAQSARIVRHLATARAVHRRRTADAPARTKSVAKARYVDICLRVNAAPTTTLPCDAGIARAGRNCRIASRESQRGAVTWENIRHVAAPTRRAKKSI